MRAALLALCIVVLGVLPVSTASAAELPLGKHNFTVAIGGLSAESTTNWVRLGLYTFHPDGTVSETHWHWTQRVRVVRTYTGFMASGCPTRNCEVQTAGGYESTGASQTLQGTYDVSGDTVRITWSGGQWEEWTLQSRDSGTLVEASYLRSNFGATYGFGYGSNAPWSERVSAADIAAVDHTSLVHTYHLWKTTGEQPEPYIDSGDGNPFWVTDWDVCEGGQCLGQVTGSGATQYYVAPARSPTGHRRDTMWSWRTANADGRGEYCYTGNSHVKPMLQVIDDDGDFHGWVGIEASLNQTTGEGPYADDIGVFRIAG